MADYRAYIVGSNGHFQDFKVVDASTDEDAVESARKLVDGHDIEVWHLDRKLAVLKSPDKS